VPTFDNCPLCHGIVKSGRTRSVPAPGGAIEVKEVDCARCGAFLLTEEAETALADERRRYGASSLLPFSALASLRRAKSQSPPILVTDGFSRPDAHVDIFTLASARRTYRVLSVLASRTPVPGAIVSIDYAMPHF
jgi:hypothetical protein